jgi:hypothetical protein
MEVQLSTKKYDYSSPAVIEVFVRSKLWKPASDRVIVARNFGEANWDLSSSVPAGYTCVCTRNNGGLEDVEGDPMKYMTFDFKQADSAVVTCINQRTGDDVVAAGHSTPDPQYYYYHLKVTLVCVRSDLLPTD